jgi:transposase-like protein
MREVTKSSGKTFSIVDFYQRFPDEDDCLNYLMKHRYGSHLNCPKCKKYGRFSRMTKTPAFVCAWCGHHIHPMAGTIFQDTRTPLQKWFLAIFTFTTSRNGVSAKELQRQLDVSYQVAWRMGHQIREHMGKFNGGALLTGIVEMDESYIGGKQPGKRGRGAAGKITVAGLLEKDGPIQTQIIPNTKRETLHPIIEKRVKKGSAVHTDENPSYKNLWLKGYDHQRVNHSKGKYVQNGIHVNGVEGFWSNVKRSILGTYVSVSPKYAEKYLAEFEFR